MYLANLAPFDARAAMGWLVLADCRESRYSTLGEDFEPSELSKIFELREQLVGLPAQPGSPLRLPQSQLHLTPEDKSGVPVFALAAIVVHRRSVQCSLLNA